MKVFSHTCMLLGAVAFTLAMAANMPGALADSTDIVGAGAGNCRCCDDYPCSSLGQQCNTGAVSFRAYRVDERSAKAWNCACETDHSADPCGSDWPCSKYGDMSKGNMCELGYCVSEGGDVEGWE